MQWNSLMAASTAIFLFSVPSLALEPSFYPEATKVWGGALPGQRTHYTPDVGYPDELPNATHGGAVYAGWSVTNGFARHWNINYNLLNLRAEPKHGLWRWKFPGATRDFWWCELGGQWDGADGFADGTDVQWGMGKIWEQIRKSPMNSVDSFGYLGKGTKLADYVNDMVPVELSTKSGASIWRNKGSSSAPKYQRMWAYGVEFYLFTAYYGWPTMLAGTPCTGGKISGDGCDSLVHQFIAMVLPDAYSGFVGLPTCADPCISALRTTPRTSMSQMSTSFSPPMIKS
uniref:Phospholipase B-like n=1 Tax=Chrysotila carterae TaxID=13221 RepID=A0A7S4BB85_CHRCT